MKQDPFLSMLYLSELMRSPSWKKEQKKKARLEERLRPTKPIRIGAFRYRFSGMERDLEHRSTGWFDEKFKERWLVHDNNDFCAGVFESGDQAEAACRRWTDAKADLLTVAWQASPEGSDDSHRGTYTVSLDGCRAVKRFCCGWHTMEAQIAFTHKFRDLIGEYGIEAARAFWASLA